jgi:predicted kinase
METTYRVVFSGNLLAGSDPVEASKKIAADFGMSVGQAEKLVTAGQRVIVKKGIDRKTGEMICHRLKQAGLEVELMVPPTAPLDESPSKT